MNKKKIIIILLFIIMLIIVVVVGTKVPGIITKEMKYKEFQKIETVETLGELEYAEDENMANVKNMEFVYQNNTGVKVNSISITDDTLKANVSFKVDKDFEYRTFSYSYAIYDENKNVYEIFPRMHLGDNSKYDYASLCMQKELGIDKKKDIYSIYLADRAGIENVNKNEDEKIINTTITIGAKEKFPLSKKIFIKIWDLGYYNLEKDNEGNPLPKNVDLNNSKWQFELPLPEEMNVRNTINLKLDKEIPECKITSMTLTDTKLVINFVSEEYLSLIEQGKDMVAGEFSVKCKEMLNITDGDGKIYQELGGGTTGENNSFKIIYDVTRADLSKKLYFNFKVNDKEYKSELIKSE